MTQTQLIVYGGGALLTAGSILYAIYTRRGAQLASARAELELARLSNTVVVKRAAADAAESTFNDSLRAYNDSKRLNANQLAALHLSAPDETF